MDIIENCCVKQIYSFYSDSRFILIAFFIFLGFEFVFLYSWWLSSRLPRKLEEKLVSLCVLPSKEEDETIFYMPYPFKSRNQSFLKLCQAVFLGNKKLIPFAFTDNLDFKKDFSLFLRFQMKFIAFFVFAMACLAMSFVPYILCAVFYYKLD